MVGPRVQVNTVKSDTCAPIGIATDRQLLFNNKPEDDSAARPLVIARVPNLAIRHGVRKSFNVCCGVISRVHDASIRPGLLLMIGASCL